MSDRDLSEFWRGTMLKRPMTRLAWPSPGVPDFPICVHCLVLLDRHQPDEVRPEKILGTCSECGAWYLVDQEHREVHALPDLLSFQNEAQ